MQDFVLFFFNHLAREKHKSALEVQIWWARKWQVWSFSRWQVCPLSFELSIFIKAFFQIFGISWFTREHPHCVCQNEGAAEDTENERWVSGSCLLRLRTVDDRSWRGGKKISTSSNLTENLFELRFTCGTCGRSQRWTNSQTMEVSAALGLLSPRTILLQEAPVVLSTSTLSPP